MTNRCDLEMAVEMYFQHLADKGHEDQDCKYENDIFEKAVISIKGEKAFDEINSLIDKRDEDEE